MSEWVSETEISLRLGYKILIAGLSEAGKTAVKRVFFLGHSSEEVSGLSATINYERMIVNIGEIPVTIVDLGGQRVFMKRFLGTFSPFIFSAVRAFLFLIDVENRATRNNSVQYFASCIEKLQRYSPNAQYFVFLHKNDLVRHWPNYESIHGQLKEQFQLESPNRVTFFKTTIYSPETVINGFGRIFEIGMPELAESEFVRGRRVDQTEEFAKEHVTFRKPLVEEEEITLGIQPKAKTPSGPQITSSTTPAKIAGDPETFAKLQGLMKTLGKGESSVSVADRPDTSMQKLQDLMRAALKTGQTVPTLDSYVPDTDERLGDHHLELLHSIDETVEEPEIEEEPIERHLTPEEEREARMRFISKFYGIEREETKAIVESGYADVFEIAATSRIPIPTVLNVLLKYIPFIKTKGLDVETLDRDKLLDILAAYLRGSISERGLLRFLIIAAKRPDLLVDEIAEEYFAQRPQEVPTVRGELKPTIEEPPEPAEPPVSVKAETAGEIIPFPDSAGTGFRVELTPELNCRLFFYRDRQPVGQTLVSSAITRENLMYLLYHEVQHPFERGTTSIYHAARVIHDAIRNLRGDGP